MTTEPNPILSAQIRSDREKLRARATPADTSDDTPSQEAASAARRLTNLLREAGEPEPAVQAVPRSPIGPCAVTYLAGTPVVQTRTGLHLVEYTGKELRMSAIPNLASISTRDESMYVNPQDYDLLEPDDYESLVYPMDKIDAVRHAADQRAEQQKADRDARRTYQDRLTNLLTPFQLELANKAMFGEVTYLEWLTAQPAGTDTQAWEHALDTIRSIRPV